MFISAFHNFLHYICTNTRWKSGINLQSGILCRQCLQCGLRLKQNPESYEFQCVQYRTFQKILTCPINFFSCYSNVAGQPLALKHNFQYELGITVALTDVSLMDLCPSHLWVSPSHFPGLV